jgi:ribosomal protein S18 acetylase RimI-like enzyme
MTTEKLSYRAVGKRDFEIICRFPQNLEELFFMFPKAEYPFTVNQLETAVENRFDSTVILYDEEIAGFANFYEVKRNEHCSIGNVIVNPKFRNIGIGKFLIETMENIGAEKYNVSEFRLSCFNTNINGILLYSKLGYKPYEIEKRTGRENEIFALIKMKRRNNAGT